MPQKDPSRTEKPTPKRLNKARGEGNVPKSQEISTVVTILSGAAFLYFWCSYMGLFLMDIYRFFLGEAILQFNPTDTSVMAMVPWLGKELAMMLLPPILFVGLCVFISTRRQVGHVWSTKVFQPKLSKFNPVNGLKRMFVSLQTFIRMSKSLLTATCIGFAVYFVISDELDNLYSLYYLDASGLAGHMLWLAFKMVMYAMIPMIVISVADIIYTRWDYIENLKMTKDEIKDEMKQMEGDPLIKSKQRQKMMQMMRRRMLQEVPKADVVITNPTHLAVALRYNQMEAPAPMVVAKGADRVAEKIKEIARENKVPIRENVPLARALYKQVEIGDMIPEDLYKVVATLLAQIWRIKGKGSGQPGQNN